MKTFKYIFGFCLAVFVFFGCEEDDNTDLVNNFTAPTKVSAAVNIVPDNSGLTQITPIGEGVASFIVDYGDGSEPSESFAPGGSVEHMYIEGTFEVLIKAYSVNGLETVVSQAIVVSFRAPENIVINATIDASNPFIINVSATADYASSFLVFFDTSNVDEEGTPLELGGTVSFEYPVVGDYTLKVVALSGGTESSELTGVVTISAPTELPIDFEIFDAATLIGFGGASNAIIANPDTNGNSSATVAQIIKNAPEIWAGNVITASAPIDFSTKKVIKMKVWSPRAGGKLLLKVENLSDSTIFFESEVTTIGNSAWEEVAFDLSAMDTTQEYQKLVFFFDFGLVGDGSTSWTFYIDDINQSVPSTGATGIPGIWKMASEAGSLGVGPAVGDISWFACDDDCVTARACYFDDTYVFGADGSFKNVLGTETWTEPWQGGGDSCGTPVAPHNESAVATYTYDQGAGKITLNGIGAYIGLAKANNAGELSSSGDAPASITYDIEFLDDDTISVTIEAGPGIFWQYVLVRDGVVETPLTGTWQMASEAGSLGVGPAIGDISWFACDGPCVTARACYFDDLYVFGADGSFTNVLGSDTWTEPWQGGSDSCGTPVAPHDGLTAATYIYNLDASTFTLYGAGAYIGLAKANNEGELASPGDAPDSITYDVTFIDSDTISVYIEAGSGIFWQYKLIKI